MLQQVVTHTVHAILGLGGFKSRLDRVTVFIVEATQPLPERMVDFPFLDLLSHHGYNQYLYAKMFVQRHLFFSNAFFKFLLMMAALVASSAARVSPFLAFFFYASTLVSSCNGRNSTYLRPCRSLQSVHYGDIIL
jgi:hypothetical protein